MAESMQRTDTVVMVRPNAFEFNPDTAPSNRYQAQTAPAASVHAKAEAEFDALVSNLRSAGVTVVVFDDTPEPHTPDALFPNNWFSTHADGTFVTYPMLAPSRRGERRRDIATVLVATHGRQIAREIDFSTAESSGQFLEGTGSLVLDRQHNVAFAALSARTDADLVAEVCAALGFRAETFRAVDEAGAPIYHTNVCMALGERWAILCSEAIPDAAERARIEATATASGRDLVRISQAQVRAFCGNALELESGTGEPLIALSASAANALSAEQTATLTRHARLVSTDIGAIEALAGGSVRCMLAEVFLPHRA